MTYQFLAGNLALDFINANHLRGASGLSRWALEAGFLDDENFTLCSRMSPTATRRVFSAREPLFDIFEAAANKRPIPSKAVKWLDAELRNVRARRVLSIHENGRDRSKVAWTWRRDATPADFLLYPILTTAAGLLTSNARSRIRQCAGESCGRLFVDRSNARKRRWCSMSECGNRRKARDHYRRTRNQKANEPY
jgi:predicted RNA-binding Zn ribbon-like protein